jgi:hypothetical protein
MKIPVDWDDQIFIWAGSEDFIWDDAYRVVQQVSAGLGILDLHRKRPWDEVEKRVPKDVADKFLNIVVKVNGLTRTFQRKKIDKADITVDHIQKTFRAFGQDVKVKAEIKK